MPEISLPPSPLPAAAVVASADSRAGPVPGDAAADVQSSPFAAVLMQQMAAGIAASSGLHRQIAVPVEAATDTTADPSVVAENLLPNLLAMMDPAAFKPPVASANGAGSALAPGDAAAITTAAVDPAAGAAPTAAPFIAPVSNAALPQQAATDASAEAGHAAAGGQPAAPTAILAGAADAAGARAAAASTAKAGAEPVTALSASQEQAAPRGEGLTPHTPAVHAQNGMATRVDAPVGSRQWDGEFANKLAWMVTRNEQRAELVLNPPQLGRVEVSIAVNGEQATATFTSAHAGVREAIEQAMPRLREVLLESGINLGQTHVGSESPQQSPGKNENKDNPASILATSASGALAGDLAGSAPANALRGGRGLIDVFA